MCGLAGFLNVPPDKRERLVRALGEGIDTRGGHAAGYVAIHGAAVTYNRKSGPWASDVYESGGYPWTDTNGVQRVSPKVTQVIPGASRRFIRGACGDVTILHARYATCGDSDSAAQAHPFVIKRPNEARGGATRPVLYGAHNGVVRGAKDTARAHGRDYDVDSRELFHLLADGELDAIRALQGWGTLAWIRADARDRVYLVRMTSDARLEVARTTCGALVYASTKAILSAALDAAALTLDHYYDIQVGKVYGAGPDGILRFTSHPDVTLNTYSKAEYRADRWGTERDSGRWAGASFAGDAGTTDDFWADPCPVCGSLDTWTYVDTCQCADCNHQWIAPDEDTGDPEDDATTTDRDAFDGKAFLEYLERQRDRERREAESRARIARAGGGKP